MVEYSRVVFWAAKLDRSLQLGLIVVILGPKEGKGVGESNVEWGAVRAGTSLICSKLSCTRSWGERQWLLQQRERRWQWKKMATTIALRLVADTGRRSDTMVPHIAGPQSMIFNTTSPQPPTLTGRLCLVQVHGGPFVRSLWGHDLVFLPPLNVPGGLAWCVRFLPP